MNHEKSFIPGTNPNWDLKLSDGDANSLVDESGHNWDNGYNFDEREEDEPEKTSFDDLADDTEFNPEAARKAREEAAGNSDSAPKSEEVRNHERQLGVEISNLTPDDNFEQVAEALYLVDQYIFPDLFDNEEKSKTLAKELFSDDPNALFSYSKTMVARDEDGNVVGIVVYRDSNCTPWDTEAVRKRFESTGVDLPENFDRANSGYMKKITDAELPEGAVEIEFVGVRDDYRSNGIGGRLMGAVMNKPEYTEAHLDVLDSHPGARKLYDKLGFKPSGDKFGNYPDGSEGVQHMIRKKPQPAPAEAL
ncbi:GNAT family N-acetyltransferase [Candidatus Saccharibacteria bacterium]|nr:GNAT family N-acetyltransferase [Candidatus Saccharibacteria bacterium]